MIRHQLAVEEMRPADAYVQGFQDAYDQINDDEAYTALRACSSRLDVILDRIWAVEPFPHIEAPVEDEGVFDGEA